MTDNGSCYRAIIHALTCKALGLKHLRTQPFRPRTNGKAERFIRTMLGGWAYGAVYGNSQERRAALPGWLVAHCSPRPTGRQVRLPRQVLGPASRRRIGLCIAGTLDSRRVRSTTGR
jgi:transposase InsO family protein